jgi:hypothetical protein
MVERGVRMGVANLQQQHTHTAAVSKPTHFKAMLANRVPTRCWQALHKNNCITKQTAQFSAHTLLV